MTSTSPQPARTVSPLGLEATPTQAISFRIGDQLLGVPVEQVQEVLNPLPLTRTPKARPEIAGVINLRGQIVTALSLSTRLKLNANRTDHESMNVVVSYHDELVSFLVDAIGDVVEVHPEMESQVPATLSPQWKSVLSSVYRLQNRLFLILDVGKVLEMD